MPVTTSPTSVLPALNIRNLFCPDGTPAKSKAASWLAVAQRWSVMSTTSSGFEVSGFWSGANCVIQTLAPVAVCSR
ncbi:hypothetical protein D3C72_1728920 [compost metagenome]